MKILNQHTCGQTIDTHNLFFTGTIPTFVEQSNVLTDREFNGILNKIIDKLELINDSLDLKNIDRTCFTFNTKVIKNKELHQLEIDTLCDHSSRLDEAEEALDFSIGDQIVNINLDCLLPEEFCNDNGTLFSVQSVLELFVSEVCELKDQIDTLCTPTSGVSGTSGTSGSSGTSGANGTSGTSGSGGDGTSGTQGTSGTSGSSGTSGTSAIECRNYTINYQGTQGGTTVYWLDCEYATPLSLFFTNQINICSRELPTADGPVEIIDNYSCS